MYLQIVCKLLELFVWWDDEQSICFIFWKKLDKVDLIIFKKRFNIIDRKALLYLLSYTSLLQKFSMWLTYSHMWSSKNICESQIPCVSHEIIFTCETHMLSKCVPHVIHIWKFTSENSYVNFPMWLLLTCEISHVKFHVWIFTCELSHVKFPMWNFTYKILHVSANFPCEIYHVKFRMCSHVKFHMWNSTYKILHVSANFPCEISHVKFRNSSHVTFHMWNFTCEILRVTSDVKFHMGIFTCEISHVISHMGNYTFKRSHDCTCKISHVFSHLQSCE